MYQLKNILVKKILINIDGKLNLIYVLIVWH